jgi:Lrp/AsnC family transcriptional regulator, leucine-responsive regulatory protein
MLNKPQADQRVENVRNIRNAGHPRALDDIDRALLSFLQEDNQKTKEQLSELLKTDTGHDRGATACGQRINTLVKEGYIERRCDILDSKKFNLGQPCIMLVKVQNKDDCTVKKFESQTHEQKEIQEIYEVMGSYDYVIKVRVSNIDEALVLSKNLQRINGVTVETLAVGSIKKETTAIKIR